MSRSDVVGYACAIGIMSGTSADGADAALVTVERGLAPRRTKLISWRHRAFSPRSASGCSARKRERFPCAISWRSTSSWAITPR